MPAVSASVAALGSLGSIAGGISAAATAVGVGLQVAGRGDQADSQREIAEASARQERLRQRQQKLEADRRRRDIVRQSIRNSAIARSNAIAQGVSLDSSGPQGAQAQIQQSEGFNINAVNQNEQIGNSLFTESANIARSRGNAATAASTASFGQLLVNRAETIGGIAETTFGGSGFQTSVTRG